MRLSTRFLTQALSQWAIFPALALLLVPGCIDQGPYGPPPGWHPSQSPPSNRSNSLLRIQQVADQISASAGLSSSSQVTFGPDPGPTCSLRYSSGITRILVNPRAAREVPLNCWAFILGHEFAHRATGTGHRGSTDPALEQRMDYLGARYALQAGYDLQGYLAWMNSRPGSSSSSHGSSRHRAQALARRFY